MSELFVMAHALRAPNFTEVYLQTDDAQVTWDCWGPRSGGTKVAVLKDADIDAAVRFCPPGSHVIQYGRTGIGHQEANQILAAATPPGSPGIVVPGSVPGVRSSYLVWGVYGRQGKRHLRPSDLGLPLHDISAPLTLEATREEFPEIQIPTEAELPRVLSLANDLWDRLIAHLSCNPHETRQLDPRRFEELVAELLSRDGFDVTLTPKQKDGGRDIHAFMNSRLGRHLVFVECKRYAADRPVDVSVVRGLHGVVALEGATAGMVVTTSRFTSAAVEVQRALEHRMAFCDYTDLSSWLREHARPHGSTSGNSAA